MNRQDYAETLDQYINKDHMNVKLIKGRIGERTSKMVQYVSHTTDEISTRTISCKDCRWTCNHDDGQSGSQNNVYSRNK